jgi:hypothetical protein
VEAEIFHQLKRFHSLSPGTDVKIFKNILAEKFRENIGVFLLKLLLV